MVDKHYSELTEDEQYEVCYNTAMNMFNGPDMSEDELEKAIAYIDSELTRDDPLLGIEEDGSASESEDVAPGNAESQEIDANGDGDSDVLTADTNGNGEDDTAVVAGDTAKEEKEAVDTAKEELGMDSAEQTSTGKKKGELDDEDDDTTVSDERQKNIVGALLDRLY